jgi:hypothetical protein
MFMPPTPILAPFAFSQPPILPIPPFTALFHKPVSVCAMFTFIPFMPVTVLAVIVPMVIFSKTRCGCEKRGGEQHCDYDSFHSRFSRNAGRQPPFF